MMGRENLLIRILKFLVNDRWERCHAPSDAERKALYYRRLGEYKAQEELRKERIGQAFDFMASKRLHTKPGRVPLPGVIRRKLKVVK